MNIDDLIDKVKTDIEKNYHYNIYSNFRDLECEFNARDANINSRINVMCNLFAALLARPFTFSPNINLRYLHNTLHKEMLQQGVNKYLAIHAKLTEMATYNKFMLVTPFVPETVQYLEDEYIRGDYIKLSYIGLSILRAYIVRTTESATDSTTAQTAVALAANVDTHTLDFYSELVNKEAPAMISFLYGYATELNLDNSKIYKYLSSIGECDEEAVSNEVAIYVIDPDITSFEMRSILPFCCMLKERGYILYLLHSITYRTVNISSIFEKEMFILPSAFNPSVARKMLRRPFRAMFSNVDNCWTAFYKVNGCLFINKIQRFDQFSIAPTRIKIENNKPLAKILAEYKFCPMAWQEMRKWIIHSHDEELTIYNPSITGNDYDEGTALDINIYCNQDIYANYCNTEPVKVNKKYSIMPNRIDQYQFLLSAAKLTIIAADSPFRRVYEQDVNYVSTLISEESKTTPLCKLVYLGDTAPTSTNFDTDSLCVHVSENLDPIEPMTQPADQQRTLAIDSQSKFMEYCTFINLPEFPEYAMDHSEVMRLAAKIHLIPL